MLQMFFNDSIIDLDELPSLNVLNEAAFKSGLYSGSSYTLLKRLIDALNKNYGDYIRQYPKFCHGKNLPCL